MIYCSKCGLYMSNGFCLHGSVAEARQRWQPQIDQRERIKSTLVAMSDAQRAMVKGK